MELHTGFSEDGLNWDIDPEPIEFVSDDPEIGNFVYGYDPRVVRIEDRYYVTWCNWYHGPTIGVAWTDDFVHFHQQENAYLPVQPQRRAVPPQDQRPLRHAVAPVATTATRRSVTSSTARARTCAFWGRHRHVMSPIANSWQATKVGGGPVPDRDLRGLAADLPRRAHLLQRVRLQRRRGPAGPGRALEGRSPARRPTCSRPQTPYECVGDVPNVVFPCAMLCDEPTRRLAIYYGAADTVTAMAFGYVSELVEFAKEHSVAV